MFQKSYFHEADKNEEYKSPVENNIQKRTDNQKVFFKNFLLILDSQP